MEQKAFHNDRNSRQSGSGIESVYFSTQAQGMARKSVDSPRPQTMMRVGDGSAESSENAQDDAPAAPLDERVLKLVASNPSKVYATRLVTELGLSHEDASAELCGLMAPSEAKLLSRLNRCAACRKTQS